MIPLYSLIKGTYLAASYPSTTARYKHLNLRLYRPLAFNLQIECRLDSLHYYGLITGVWRYSTYLEVR